MTKPSADVAYLPGARRAGPAPRPAIPAPRASASLKAPAWLSAPAKRRFATFVAAANEARPGHLTDVDTELVALAVEALITAEVAATAMRGKGNVPAPIDHDRAHAGRPRKHPATMVYREAMGSYVGALRSLGLTPLERSRAETKVKVDGDDDLFDA